MAHTPPLPDQALLLKPPRRRRAVATLILLAMIGSLCGLGGGLWWIGGSDGGLRWLGSALTQWSAGRLQIDGIGGRLFGDWHAQSLRWRDASAAIELTQLTVSWSPGALLHGQLAFERIEAASLRIVPAAPGAPATLPEHLQLPLAVRVAQLRLGQLAFADHAGAGALFVDAIDAAFDSDGRTHRLKRLQARLGLLVLDAEASLSGQPPFALQAHAALSGVERGQSFSLELLGSGSLDRVRVDGKAVAGADPSMNPPRVGATGEVHAVLTPFTAPALASLRVQLSGINPALLAAGAPRALLDVDLMLDGAPAVAGKSRASGDLRITNRDSGRFDRQLLPLQSVQARIHWQGDALTFDSLVFALAGGGRLAGQGRLAGAQLELELIAQRVNAHALHDGLLPTRLAGPLRASLGLDHQRVDVDWRDSRFVLSAIASVSPEAIELAHLRLSSGGARLAAQGTLALIGDERFMASGRLENFDPARFWQSAAGRVPRGLFNAVFEARGARRPTFDLGLQFALRDSRIEGQALSGKGDVDLLGSRLRKVDIDLEAAGNHLHAEGALGRPGDALRLTLLAPRLGALAWSGLAGDARATLAINGSLASPEFSGQLQSGRLQLGSWLDFSGLSIDARLAGGAQGTLSGKLHCSSCALPAAGVPALTLDLAADGVRSQHRLSGLVGLPEKRELRFALDGALYSEAGQRTSGVAPMSWRGTLSELRLGSRSVLSAAASAPPLLELVAPAALQVGAKALSFGPATFAGRLGRLSVDRLGHDRGRWQSVGRLQQFSLQQMLVEFPSLQGWREVLGTTTSPSLVLAGEWDVALGDRPIGRAALWREQGDLRLGALPLGLSEARLQATLGEGRVALSGQVRGARLGEISAELTALSADAARGRAAGATSQSAAPPLIDAQAPWQGRLRASMPDLAWLGPLLGEGWQVAGQLQGEMRLAGSAARPQFSGEWRGDNLALRALDQGMHLERGQALLEITPERLLLRRLSFESDLQPLPRELQLDERIDAASLRSTPGRLEASGELALAGARAGSAARLGLRLDRVGIMQRPEQWAAVSGEGEIRIGERLLEVGGKLRVDAGFWALAPSGRPSLSDDVVRRGAPSEKGGSRVGRALKLDLEVALGRSVHFRGAGVTSRLAGDLRIRSDDAGLPRATGSIRAVDGRFDAYGQKLEIERGIVNFQGSIDNPGLNLLAVRKNLPVEAGVEVTGTAQRPLIRLVSTPTVPDAEKLSWLVLGHSPEQQGGGDSSLLLAAAQTIFGGQEGGVLRQLQRGLGIDEFGVSSGQVGGYNSLLTSRVASSTGFGSNQTVNGQIVSVGKRLSSNALLSYEQSLNTTESIVKLTVNLNRQFSVVGRAGTESALDLFWNCSFGR